MAKILVCADGFFRAFSPFGLEPYIESFIDVLVRNGNEVLTYIDQDFKVKHKLKRKYINYKTRQEIKKFNPDLIIAFNNAINPVLVEKLHAPILIVASDTPIYWHHKDFIKNNNSRYSVAYLNNDMADTLRDEYGIPLHKQVLIPYSTDIHANNTITPNKDISFIGNFYNHEVFLSNLYVFLKNKAKDKNLCKQLFVEIIDELGKSKKQTQKINELCAKLSKITKESVVPEILIPHIFCMLTNKKRTELLSGLLNHDLHLYSHNCAQTCLNNNYELFKKLEPSNVFSLADTERIYNESRICINMPHAQVNTGFSWRVCDILASNALLISNPSKDLDRLFGGIIPTYNNADELRAKVEYYLSHDKERQEIIKKCQKIIDKNHRFENVLAILENFTRYKLLNLGLDGKTILLSRTKKLQNKYEKRQKKLKIIAVVHTLYTNTFDTLYYEAKKRPDIDFKFVVIPFKQGNFQILISKIKQMMKDKGYPYKIGYNGFKYMDLKKMKPDVIFLQTPYDSQRVSPLYSVKYLSTIADVYHISYGATMLDYDDGRYKNLLTGLLKNYTGIFSESTPLANFLNKYNPGKYIPVGYMKCDKYLHYSRILQTIPRDKQYDFIIAWKPRWVGDFKGSNLLNYLNFFMDLCQQNPKTQLVFVKHQLCEQNLIQNKILPANEVHKLFARLYAMPNIKVVEDKDFLDYVFNADVFVGDYCSTIMEFALTKKPVIYTPVDDVVLSDYGKKILDAWYVARDMNELQKYITNIQNNKDTKKHARESIYNLLTDTPDNNRTIAQSILDYLTNKFYNG